MEDGERLREQAQEGGVGLKEEVAKANRKLLGLKDLFKGREATDEPYLGGSMISAVKDDVVSCVLVESRPV